MSGANGDEQLLDQFGEWLGHASDDEQFLNRFRQWLSQARGDEQLLDQFRQWLGPTHDDGPLLDQFRQWLSQARGDEQFVDRILQWLRQTRGDGPLLDQFRQWLSQARAEVEPLECRETEQGEPAGEGESNARDVGLYQLVEEFTALRQEVKLQTRSARGLDEQTQALLSALQQALEALRSVEPQEPEQDWAARKPLALALAELDEALDRGRAQMEKAGARLTEAPAGDLLAELDELNAAQSWWRRRLLDEYHRRLRRLVADRLASADRQTLFDALLEGYSLIQQRLARALAAEGIARMDAAGKTVDPEQMVVVEVADAPGAVAGTVIDEIRRGYVWNGRVLRYAEVRAARGG